MKTRNYLFSFAAFVLAMSLLLTACETSPQSQSDVLPQLQQAIAAGGTAGGMLYWTGDGGKGTSIAVFNMSSPGLNPEEQHIPLLLRGALVEAFNRYSAMDVMDMVQLEQLIRDGESDFYADENEIIQMGEVVPSRYQLRGNIQRTTAGFLVQFNVVEAANARQRATFNDTFLISQIDDLSGVRRASGDILAQMGINLTAAGQEALMRPASANQIQAHNALAQGITAQRGGTEIRALSHYIRAAAFDPTLAEAVSRVNILAANISTGNMGEDIRNDIQWRDQWVAHLNEVRELFTAYTTNMPFYIVYSTNIDHVRTDFQRRTAEFRTRISIIHDAEQFIMTNRVMRTVIPSVQDGLYATGRANAWGLSNWLRPAGGRDTLPARGVRSSRVEVELLNANGQSLSRQTVNLNHGWERLNNPRWYHANPVFTLFQNVTFSSVDANLITDRMTIRINSIDGIPAAAASRQRQLSILTEEEYNNIPSVITNGLSISNLMNFGLASSREIRSLPTSATVLTRDNNSYFIIPFGVHSINITSGSGGNFRGVTHVKFPESVVSIRWDNFTRIFPELGHLEIPAPTARVDFRGEAWFYSITVPANLEIASTNNFVVGTTRLLAGRSDFREMYIRNGKRAGIYSVVRRAGIQVLWDVTWL